MEFSTATTTGSSSTGDVASLGAVLESTVARGPLKLAVAGVLKGT
jgi:hypothetical protein